MKLIFGGMVVAGRYLVRPAPPISARAPTPRHLQWWRSATATDGPFDMALEAAGATRPGPYLIKEFFSTLFERGYHDSSDRMR
jgi:hypothetical protein